MRILLLDPKTKKYSHNAYLHLGLWEHMQSNHKIVRVSNYKYPQFSKNIVPKEGSFLGLRAKDFEKIIIKHKLDIIIVYNSHDHVTKEHKHTLGEIAKIDIPKFYICGDFFRNKVQKSILNDIKIGNFSKVFFRQKRSIWPETKELNPSWLPYSIDINRFRSNSFRDIEKKNKKVGFVGSGECILPTPEEMSIYSKKQIDGIISNSTMRNKLYYKRISAINFLNEKGLMKQTPFGNLSVSNRQRNKLFGDKYIKFLTSNMFGITCSGSCDFLVSKYFEIPASYSILICTDAEGLEIFPDDMYLKYNNNDLNSLYNKIISIINDSEKARYMMYGLADYVYKFHSHEAREREFLEQIKEIL